MWNITISISELSRIIKEVYTFYDSYPLETKVTLTKLRFQLNNNIFPPVNASIDVEETAHTINPLIITLYYDYLRPSEEFIFDNSKIIFHMQIAMADYYSNLTNTATTTTSNSWSVNTTTTADLINNYSNYATTTVPYNDIYATVERTTTDMIREIVDDYEKEKEKNMNTNFSFGPYNTSNMRLSIYGIAIKNNADKWVSYDKKTHNLVDVEVLNFNISSKKVFFKLPKPIAEVKAGDIILHNYKPMFVEKVREDGKFEAIDPTQGTMVIILPLTSPFGFNFVESIISLTDMMPSATADNPFGNFLPLLLANDEDNSNIGLMMMLMNQNKTMNMDPNMLMLLMGNGDNLGTYMMLQMMNNNNKTSE